ncbi:hypothetical protein B0T09DRAFT_395024 [Sordaria sp. MPI-SDFR-AT-0083]|nr:hypothetical protein B0T09DRAFT_395024 [Sordaria sp. MPI-SDFR-AT-0083]
MSKNKQNKCDSLLDTQLTCSDDHISTHKASNRSTSSNTRTNTYVAPHRRAITSNKTNSESAALSALDWRRKAETHNSTPQTKAAAEQALIKGFTDPTFTAEERLSHDFSLRYKGDITNPNSLLGISPEDNCALFLTNLPVGTTDKILLDALGIHALFGRVYATSIAPTTYVGGHSSASCAKIVMFNREYAVYLYHFNYARNLRIAGRTVGIRGPVEVVNVHRLSPLFNANLKYDTQGVATVLEDNHQRVLRWTFCSFRAQAQAARKLLRSTWPSLHVRWGIDPMALPINMLPDAQSTMPVCLRLPQPQLIDTAGNADNDDKADDLITFSDDDDDDEAE